MLPAHKSYVHPLNNKPQYTVTLFLELKTVGFYDLYRPFGSIGPTYGSGVKVEGPRVEVFKAWSSGSRGIDFRVRV